MPTLKAKYLDKLSWRDYETQGEVYLNKDGKYSYTVSADILDDVELDIKFTEQDLLDMIFAVKDARFSSKNASSTV